MMNNREMTYYIIYHSSRYIESVFGRNNYVALHLDHFWWSCHTQALYEISSRRVNILLYVVIIDTVPNSLDINFE